MTPEQHLYDTLTADAGVTGLVGTRIYRDESPEDVELPCLVASRIGSQTETLLSGVVAGEKVQQDVHCYAQTRQETEALAIAVKAALGPAAYLLQNHTSEIIDWPDESIDLSVLTFDRWHC